MITRKTEQIDFILYNKLVLNIKT